MADDDHRPRHLARPTPSRGHGRNGRRGRADARDRERERDREQDLHGDPDRDRGGPPPPGSAAPGDRGRIRKVTGADGRPRPGSTGGDGGGDWWVAPGAVSPGDPDRSPVGWTVPMPPAAPRGGPTRPAPGETGPWTARVDGRARRFSGGPARAGAGAGTGGAGGSWAGPHPGDGGAGDGGAGDEGPGGGRGGNGPRTEPTADPGDAARRGGRRAGVEDPPPRRRPGTGSNGGGGSESTGGRPVARDDDDDGDGGGTPPDRPPGALGRLPGWVVPVVLGAGAAVAGVGALALDQHAAAAPVEAAATPVTPVLSARRAPEVIAAPVADRRLTADLQAWLTQSPPDTCLVVESGDDTLYAHNPAAPLAGASTQKVVTAAALLLALGPDARLETRVGAASAPSGGVVSGDLYVVGGGDPLLVSPGYADRMRRDPSVAVDPMRLVDAIVEAGITRIDGSVVGDGTRYDGERFHPAWPGRFRGTEVGPLGALTVNDGLAGADGVPQPSTLAAAGDPAANAAAVVTDLLRQRGVTVAGPPRADQAPEDLAEVATFESPTVREIVAGMLADSDDQTAEMAIKELGHREGGAGTWEAGVAAVGQLLQEAGVPLDGVRVVEGSGLSTDNRLSCQLLVDLLTLPEVGPVLVEGLAVAGETGTLADRWNGTPVEGRLVGKTGTLNTVTALSGRVSPLQGGALTFAYVANVPEGQVLGADDVALQDTLGTILVDYPRGVDPATLVPAPPSPAEPDGG